jgi:hypothetical protein
VSANLGKGSDGAQANDGAKGAEGGLIRFLAPAHKSRPRLMLMALLLTTWIAILIGLYLSTPPAPAPSSPASSRAAVAFLY